MHRPADLSEPPHVDGSLANLRKEKGSIQLLENDGEPNPAAIHRAAMCRHFG